MLGRLFSNTRLKSSPTSNFPFHPLSSLRQTATSYHEIDAQPRQGLLRFLRARITVLLALIGGLACVSSVVSFTSWLSQFTPKAQWPTWAIGQPQPSSADIYIENISTVQGFATALYSVGLLSLAYWAHAFSESALWPLLNKQHLSIEQIQTYLDASRGSIPASPFALFAARNLEYALVVVITFAISLVPLTGALFMGHAYSIHNETVAFKSQSEPGGGIGLPWRQTNPPGVLRDAPMVFYSSWSRNIAKEPMPEYREWFVNREKLSRRGDFSVNAVKIIQDIECRGLEVKPEMRNEKSDFTVDTEMHNRDKRHSAKVVVRDEHGLSVWAHNYTKYSDIKSTLTVIFAAINGYIDQGIETSEMPKNSHNSHISSVACDISVEFIEDIMTVANGPASSGSKTTFKNETINSLSELNSKGNELALWVAAAPIVNGASAFGAQPIYGCTEDGLFSRSTSITSGEMSQNCTVESIKEFIRISAGALLLGEQVTWPKPAVNFTSCLFVKKLDSSRSTVLLAPPLTIIGLGLLLALWNIGIHKSRALPRMRSAPVSEILESSQTTSITAAVKASRRVPGEKSQLTRLKVQFVKDENSGWGLHS